MLPPPYTVSIVDISTGNEVATVPVGDQPAAVRITPNGLEAVVGNAVDQSLSVIDIATATELQRIPGAGFVSTVTLSFEPGVVTYRINGFEVPSNTLAVHPDFLADHPPHTLIVMSPIYLPEIQAELARRNLRPANLLSVETPDHRAAA